MSHEFDRSFRAKLRLFARRRAYLLRGLWSQGKLRPIQSIKVPLKQDDVVLFASFRNERHRLDEFLNHYRQIGVKAFYLVDNDSTDAPKDVLVNQDDVALWHTKHSYKKARYGQDWMNGLMHRYGLGKWCLCVDLDELLVYPHHDTRSISTLCAWLESRDIYSMAAPLIDLFQLREKEGLFFDEQGYRYALNPLERNIWMQGGMRARIFFSNAPEKAPALNKIPLVKWRRGTVYASSMHNLLPRKLNVTYHTEGTRLTGALLHSKFADAFEGKIKEEFRRNEHYKSGREYQRYHAAITENFDHPWAVRYENWQQLETLGLISRGAWV